MRNRLHDGSPWLGLSLLALAALSITALLLEGSRPAATAGIAPFPYFDKLLHFSAHCWVAGLMFWGGLLLGRPKPLRQRTLVWAVLVLALDGSAGVVVEFVQRAWGARYGRQFDWKDVTANVAGAFFAVCVSAIICFAVTRRRDNRP